MNFTKLKYADPAMRHYYWVVVLSAAASTVVAALGLWPFSIMGLALVLVFAAMIRDHACAFEHEYWSRRDERLTNSER